jgi:uridine phosphorylase
MSAAETAVVVDKAAEGQGERQYHIGIAPGEVGTVALLPGDPFRVPMIAEFLTDVREVAHQREHRTMTGYYKGRLITATSTGMGCPSTAIAVEELARVGVTSLIRVGSSVGLQVGVNPGDLLISEGSLRNDGTTAAYVHPGYPAVPDLPITMSLQRQAEKLASTGGLAAAWPPRGDDLCLLQQSRLRGKPVLRHKGRPAPGLADEHRSRPRDLRRAGAVERCC